MNDLELAQQRAAMAKRSADLAASARTSPLKSSGGLTRSTSDAPREPSKAPGIPMPHVTSTASDMGGAQDTGGPAKMYGDNTPLNYLGHFANDNVTTEGHNIGHKPKGAVTNPTVAKAGYLKLPHPSDRRFDGADYAADARNMPPQSQADLHLSMKHHGDSIMHETRHERDHRRGKARAERMGDTASIAYHGQHLAAHAKKRGEHEMARADVKKKLHGGKKKGKL